MRTRPRLALVAGLALVLSACSLIYELLAAQTLALHARNTVVWYSCTVGAYLASMGLGAWWSGRLRARSLWSTLFRVEVALCLVGAALVPLLVLAHGLYGYFVMHENEAAGLTAFLGTAALLVVTVGLLTGVELPVLMRLGGLADGRARDDVAGTHDGPTDAAPPAPALDPVPAPDDAHDDTRANAILGVDYLGSLLGGLLFPLLLLPHLSLFQVGCVTAAVNLAGAAVLAAGPLRGAPRAGGRAAALALLTGGLVTAAVRAPDFDAWMLRSYYFYIESSETLASRFDDLAEYPEVERVRSPYQRIDMVPDPEPSYFADLMGVFSTKLQADPGYPVDNILFLNGAFQTNTRYDEVYHEWFAHVPISVDGEVPADVLVIGGGDGLLVRELVKYDGVERITHVDLDGALVDLARHHPVLRHANGGALDDPRVESVIQDGFQFVRRSERQWDAVFIDFPVAHDYDLAKLYSREFFHFVRERIAPGGFAVFDATGISLVEGLDAEPRELTAGNDWPIYRDTLRAAGFRTLRPYLTTLDRHQPGALAHLRASGMTFEVDPELHAAIQATDDPREKLELTNRALQVYVDAHVIALEQGFIMMTPEERELRPVWRDPGVELHVLDGERFAASFEVPFPVPPDVDGDLVNSILRPTFPTSPWWAPRLPY